ncbi:MAG: hypothetical protein OEX22_06900 [Cyclobacteriaceae bacterium]|nr:hypothetical protein [Cyclobacteriaceae bacterium]
MKVKHIVVLYLISELILVSGATFKILHLSGAPELIIVSTAVKTIVVLLAIWKVMSSKKYQDFLNS